MTKLDTRAQRQNQFLFAAFVALIFAPSNNDALADLNSAQTNASREIVEWSKLPDLPDKLGVAGPFAGTHNGGLIVAGGANFPDGVPWHPTTTGGTSRKKYYDAIYVLTKDGDPPLQAATNNTNADAKVASEYGWVTANTKLPQPIGYGVSISTSQGLLCIGGEWQEHPEAAEQPSVLKRSASVVLIRWDREKQRVTCGSEWSLAIGDTDLNVALPELPKPTTAACGAMVGDTVYIAAGDQGHGGSTDFWELNLNPAADENGDRKLQWKAASPIPGPGRTHAIAVEQKGDLFLFSGRNKSEGQDFVTLNDAWKYSTYQRDWIQVADIKVDGKSRCVMAGTGSKIGNDYVLIFGGAAGEVLKQHENEIPAKILAAESAGDHGLVQELIKQKNDLYDNHLGFSRDILAYNVTTDTWVKKGELPVGSPVTTNAIAWNGSIVIPSGERIPGVRTRDVWKIDLKRQSANFGIINWLVLVGYLSVLIAIGVGFSIRTKGSDDFFLAGGRVPWWAAGLSIFATMLSAITYLSIPARTYGTNWSWFILNMGIPVIAIFVIWIYLPSFRKVKTASVYEYLETRFHISVRLFGSVSFICFQLGRMGIVVLLPALALSAATGLNVYVCIVAMGIMSTLYTVLGGIEAVIWTDVVQVIVLIGGAIAALFIMTSNYDGGLSAMVADASAAGKLTLVNEWNALDFAKDGILVILLGSVFSNLLPYTSDQAILQRYLTVSSEANARRAIATNAILVIPASILFFFVGTALWTFYRTNPDAIIPLEKSDQLFPWFIANEMPAGLAGLVIAGVFAAAMSSLDSSMHSIATAATNDFYQRFGREKTSEESLRMARWLTILLGVAGTISAVFLAAAGDLTYLWDTFLSIVGLFLGTVSGLFALGIFTKRVGTFHAWLGALAGAGILAYCQFSPHIHIHGLLNGAITWCTCVAVGIITSYLVPATSKAVS